MTDLCASDVAKDLKCELLSFINAVSRVQFEQVEMPGAIVYMVTSYPTPNIRFHVEIDPKEKKLTVSIERTDQNVGFVLLTTFESEAQYFIVSKSIPDFAHLVVFNQYTKNDTKRVRMTSIFPRNFESKIHDFGDWLDAWIQKHGYEFKE